MRKLQGRLSWVAVALTVATGCMSAMAQTNFTILHSFTNSTLDGSGPEGQPVVVGSSLYGFSFYGGSSSNGAVFGMSTNGTGFSLLHSIGGGTNGANPIGSLVFSGTSFYGMTFNGGTNDGGVLFRVNTNGTSYTVLHTFRGGINDGLFPFGSPTVSGSTIYGMTVNGGDFDGGVVFSTNLVGSNFSVLHSFGGGFDDGLLPIEGVILNGSTLYGTAFYGGTNDFGVVFSVNTDGTNFKILHDFLGGSDGAFPVGKLALDGSTLYGITMAGGIIDSGVVFAVRTDGSSYGVIHQFTGGTNGGASPQSGFLVITNCTIFGATQIGGSSNQGVVYQMRTDGSDFTVLHAFSGGTNNGAYPSYGPVLRGSMLYGMTPNGGTNGLGVVYLLPVSIPPPCDSSTEFRIAGIEIQTTNVVITWLTTGGQTNEVQFTRGDANGSYSNNFIELSGLIIIPGIGPTAATYTDWSGATNKPSRYYRVRLVP